MPKAKPISDAELLAAISAAEESAIGTIQSEIASDRADAIDRYYGKPYGDEQPGRSSVVSRDVADVVEGVVANVVKPFVGGDQVVQFDPIGPDDEAAAEQETDYVNWVALERNNGFIWLVSAIKDALLLRTGYVKCNWTIRQDVISETYTGLSDDELSMLMDGGELEIAAHSEYPDPSVQMPAAGFVAGAPVSPGPGGSIPPQVPMLHDVKVKRVRPTEYVEVCPVPPDEILVSERAKGPSLQDVDFVQHRTRKTLSELRQAGYDVSDDISDSDSIETIEDMARTRFGDAGDLYDDNTGDASRRIVLYRETYLRIDRDGDGVSELRRVCQVGQTLLSDEECDIIPIASYSGVVVPHQHLGLSVYDLVEDLAKIKTALMRSYLDNRYQINNNRSAVDVDRVNVDDLLVSRPGGVVRVTGDPSSAVMPMVTPDTSSGALQGLEYLDTVRENRTGYTRNSAGMDNDALTNSTASGMAMQLSQSQLRLEMIARTIAETGVRDTFRIIHALTLKHSSRADKVRLKGQWVAINPREWVRRNDLSISIGLGTGTSEQQLAKLMALAPLMQQGQAMGLVGVDEGYAYTTEAFKLSGYKSPDRFIHAPQKDEHGQSVAPPPQKPPEVQVAEMKMQGEQQKFQAQQQADVEKFHAEQAAKAQFLQMEAAAKEREQQAQLAVQAANDQRQAELDAMENAREMHRMALEDKFKRDQMAAEFAFKQWETEMRLRSEANTQNTIARASGVDVGSEDKVMAALGPVLEAMQKHMESTHSALAGLSAPRQVVRDKSGRVVGVSPVVQ